MKDLRPTVTWALIGALVCVCGNIRLSRGSNCEGRVPEILEEVVVAEPEDDIELTCRGNFSVLWKLIDDSGWADDRITNTSSQYILNGKDTYESKLRIRNVTYDAAYLYRCYYEEEWNGPCSAYRRVFLNDTSEHLFPRDTSIKYVPSLHFVGETFTIPCVGITPEVQVSLEPQHYLEKLEGQGRISVDPERGFTVTSASVMDQNTYVCHGRLASWDESEEKTIALHVSVARRLKAKPMIMSTSGFNRVGEGESFTLVCSIDTRETTYGDLTWELPQKEKPSRVIIGTRYRKQGSRLYRNVTVTSARGNDSGVYKCHFDMGPQRYSAGFNMTVHSDSILEMRTDLENITARVGSQAMWIVQVEAHPSVKLFSWTDAYGRDIQSNETFEILKNEVQTKFSLRIKETTLKHAGRYWFSVTNFQGATASLELELSVSGPPEVYSLKTFLGSDYERVNGSVEELSSISNYYLEGEVYVSVCTALGSPTPNITWKLPYAEFFKQNPPPMYPVDVDLERGSQSVGVWRANESTTIACSVSGEEMESIRVQNISVVDFQGADENGFAVAGDHEPVEGATINITCAMFIEKGSKFFWYKNDESLEDSDRVTVTSTNTSRSVRSSLVLYNVRHGYDDGIYRCTTSADLRSGAEGTAFLTRVREKVEPKFTRTTNLNNTQVVLRLGKGQLQLVCNATGVPKPQISWFKDGEILSSVEPFSKSWAKGEEVTNITIFAHHDYNGNYSCQAKTIGEDWSPISRYLEVKVEGGMRGNRKMFIAAIGVLATIIFILLVVLSVKHISDKKSHARKVANLIKRFKEGNTESINPTLSVSEQVDLLPYDDRLEFPRENLKIGRRLGQGAFGRVYKAEAKDLIVKGEFRTVAVKEAIDSLDGSNMKALASELKILIHLGQHVNILNILGACTQGLEKGELLVIVEYCEHGNLLHYMEEVRQRKNFIDLRHAVTRDFNPNDSTPTYNFNRWSTCSRSSSNAVISGKSKIKAEDRDVEYSTLVFTDSAQGRRDSEGYRALQSMSSHAGVSLNPTLSSVMENSASISMAGSSCTGQTFLNSYGVEMNDGMATEQSAEYDNSKFITTEDLICWSYQIACGMEYLTSRKVLHGDLAARNILLGKNNIVKICDFGLSRQLYKNVYKKKKKDELLPIKWMAIESILEGKFSPFSDVWSYGVVLWELFTLGKVPYPGQDLNDPKGKFYVELMEGRRMEEPEYAPSGLYDLMRTCWNANPLQRPSFTHIVTIMEKYLTDDSLKYYHGLNEPYSKNTVEKMEGRQDYIQLMGNSECVDRELSPDNVPLTDYENLAKTKNEVDKNGYLPNDPHKLAVNEAYKLVSLRSSPDYDGTETELSTFKAGSTKPVDFPQVLNIDNESIMFTSGYVPKQIFEQSQTASSPDMSNLRYKNGSWIDVTRMSTSPSDEDCCQVEVEEVPSRRNKLDSGVYSIESHQDNVGYESANDVARHCEGIKLRLGEVIENQEYFQPLQFPSGLA